MDAKASDGTRYRLRVYQPIVATEMMDGSVDKIPGVPRIVTPNGEHVNRIEKGVYEVLTNRGVMRVTTADPKAF